MRKTPATKYGYSGATHAVGPVVPWNGELKPWPSAMERAMRPVSQPKPKWSCRGFTRYVWPTVMTASRSSSASSTIVEGRRNQRRNALRLGGSGGNVLVAVAETLDSAEAGMLRASETYRR